MLADDASANDPQFDIAVGERPAEEEQHRPSDQFTVGVVGVGVVEPGQCGDVVNDLDDQLATYTGQAVPQFNPGDPVPPGYAADAPPLNAPPPPAPPDAGPPPPIATAQYDPATGTYVGPDGKVYTQADLGSNAPQELTWQGMMMPPKTN